MTLNSQPSTLNSNAARAAFVPPILLIHNCAARVRALFPEIRQTLTLIVDWSLAQIGLQRKWSEAVRAIDDPLEQNETLIDEVLANDPPAKRRKVRALLEEVHNRTEIHSAEIAPVVQFR